jgi:hypothetical protein
LKTVEIFSTVETDIFWASRSRSRSRPRRDKSRPPGLVILTIFQFEQVFHLPVKTILLNKLITSIQKRWHF